MAKPHAFPIPPGFTWSHVQGAYVNSDYHTWDDETNVIRDRDGNVIPPTGGGGIGMAGQGLQAGSRVDSASDARTANNVMRHEYRVLSDDEKAKMKEIKDLGVAFVQLCDSLGTSRELSLAKTNAEQAVMWAVKHLTK